MLVICMSFAAPFFGQPGDGSTHNCPRDSEATINIGSCPKVDAGSVGKYGIGHISPFVPLSAIKMAYEEGSSNVCSDWLITASAVATSRRVSWVI